MKMKNQYKNQVSEMKEIEMQDEKEKMREQYI